VRAGQHDGRAAHHAGELLPPAALAGDQRTAQPLIVFTPKSLLRLKAATSATVDFTHGSFRPLIGEPDGFDAGRVRRVVLCTGKIYYDLAEHRAKSGVTDTAIVRVERLYPIPGQELQAELSRYSSDVELVWAQEEPENQGAWPRMALRLAATHRPPAPAGRAAGELGTRSSAPRRCMRRRTVN